MKKKIIYGSTGLLILLGLVTIFMGGSVIFDLFGIRAIEGHYVLFVVWVNFICGFIYLLAAYGFIRRKSWTARLLWFAAGVLILTFIGLFIHINTGGIYEKKTLGAMTFRTIITILLAYAARYSLSKK